MDHDNSPPALRYPDKTPVRVVNDLSQISGEAYSYLGKYSGAVMVACFEQMGGLPRFAEWADQNPTEFYTKLFAKTIQRSTQIDVSGTVTIDDAISRLESQPMNADYSEVIEDAAFYYDL